MEGQKDEGVFGGEVRANLKEGKTSGDGDSQRGNQIEI